MDTDQLVSLQKENQYMKLLLRAIAAQGGAIDSGTVARVADFLSQCEEEERKGQKPLGVDWFGVLPREVVMIVFSCLDFEDVSHLAVTCRGLSELGQSQSLWTSLVKKRWKSLETPASPLAVYRQRHMLETKWFVSRPVVSTMKAYKGTVTSIAILPGTTTFIATSDDGSAALWDYQDQQVTDLYQQHHRQTKVAYKTTSFWGHGGPVWGCAITQAGKLATGSSDKTVKIWSLSGKCEATLRGHSNWVTCVSAKGEVLASGSYDATVKLWDVEARTELATLSSELENHVYTIDLAPNSLVSGCLLGTINLWDLSTQQLTHQFTGHADLVSAVRFSADAELVARGSRDHSVHLWDRRSGTSEEVLRSHTSNVMCLDLDVEANRLVSGSHDKTICVWDLRRLRTPRNVLHGHSAGVFCLQCSETKIVSGSSDKTIKVWNFHG